MAVVVGHQGDCYANVLGAPEGAGTSVTLEGPSFLLYAASSRALGAVSINVIIN